MSDKHAPAADTSPPLWRRLQRMLRSDGHAASGPVETDTARMDLGYEAAYAPAPMPDIESAAPNGDRGAG